MVKEYRFLQDIQNADSDSWSNEIPQWWWRAVDMVPGAGGKMRSGTSSLCKITPLCIVTRVEHSASGLWVGDRPVFLIYFITAFTCISLETLSWNAHLLIICETLQDPLPHQFLCWSQRFHNRKHSPGLRDALCCLSSTNAKNAFLNHFRYVPLD